MRVILALTASALLATASVAAAANMTPEEIRKELIGVPLCGTPVTGQFTGKMLCTVHLADGNAILAGAGMVVRGLWEIIDGRVCRRNADDPMDRRRCVDYEKLGPNHYRNSDGIEVCLGPCPSP